ncbi:class I SAM-dependent methyltransferase [candidate division WOR-3 bacterium]|nr:class I SAM-dependent methyltransferase [candidate division WOR-3 bacterium]
MSQKTISSVSKEIPREKSSPGTPQRYAVRGVSWWESFFDENYARLNMELQDIEATRKQVDFLIDVLKLKKESRLLDVGSGTGRHVLEFARRGFERVTGLDQSRIYIEKSRTRAELEGMRASFVRADMRRIPFRDEFDAAYSYGTIFGYFERKGDDNLAIQNVLNALKPEGKLFLDVINRDWIVLNYARRGWSEHQREYTLEERKFDLKTSTAHSTWAYFTRTGTSRREMRIRLYSLHEIIALLERNGFRFEAAWDSLNKEQPTMDSYHFKILAIKEDNHE